jgi:hypothetical protein
MWVIGGVWAPVGSNPCDTFMNPVNDIYSSLGLIGRTKGSSEKEIRGPLQSAPWIGPIVAKSGNSGHR